jgi:hypothetical protein
MVQQIGWRLHSIRSDTYYPYSSSEATAAFLRSLPKGARVAAFDDDSVTVNAYMERTPYFNQKVNYWPFSRTDDPGLTLDQTIAQVPDIVVLKMASPDSPVTDQWVILYSPGTEFIPQAALRVLHANHYHQTRRFCGRRFFRNSSESTDCRLIFEPAARTSVDEQALPTLGKP